VPSEGPVETVSVTVRGFTITVPADSDAGRTVLEAVLEVVSGAEDPDAERTR
jgi:hypothetical protein